MSETPTTTTSQKSIAIRLPFVLQYASNLYCSAFGAPYALRKGKYCQYSSHLYHSTPPICITIRLPFVSQYFWENLGGCGHRDVPHIWFNEGGENRETRPENGPELKISHGRWGKKAPEDMPLTSLWTFHSDLVCNPAQIGRQGILDGVP